MHILLYNNCYILFYYRRILRFEGKDRTFLLLVETFVLQIKYLGTLFYGVKAGLLQIWSGYILTTLFNVLISQKTNLGKSWKKLEILGIFRTLFHQVSFEPNRFIKKCSNVFINNFYILIVLKAESSCT